MTDQERIELLEELMDLDPGTLHVEDILSDYDEWDSLTILAYISEIDRRFGKHYSGEQIRAFVTVADAIAAME